MNQIVLFGPTGGRKYLCTSEVPRFLDAANKQDMATKLFCCLLAFTGCRISEALSVTPAQIDAATGRIILRTLKRRREIFRAIPIPLEFSRSLESFARQRDAGGPLWGWCRQTAWRRVKAVMKSAGITGPQAMPKGLRHAFGVANAEQNVPMATTQKWLGHAKLETTAIYQQAVGREEEAFARRLWQKWKC